MTKKWRREGQHPDCLTPIRHRLIVAGVPWDMENVPGAPMRFCVTLCGSMFRLPIRRHRVFETSHLLIAPECQHWRHHGHVVGVYGHAGGRSKRDGITCATTDGWRKAMGIDWMTGKELAEAIPPAYSRWIGEQMMPVVLREMEKRKSA